MKFSMDNLLVYFLVNFILFALVLFLLMNYVFYPSINTQRISILKAIISGLIYSSLMAIYKFKFKKQIKDRENQGEE